ncbi:response regulator transcription factor [Fictibacillus sp. Mic-4]|uniref:response regulator transcription factor n=1 Tax=Fictibacillus TaxID=1329200 RepID=UPI0004010F35|nr:response regulator transcription factor [Fictibacillus gelatini]
MGQKVLIVDDETSILALLQFTLEQAGFTVITATDGKEALRLTKEENPDLMILDLMLPIKDGLEVCKEIREQRINTPILVLTAKVDECHKLLGLELGADDYLTKPFSPREVVARVKAILRRVHRINMMETERRNQSAEMKIGDIKIHFLNYEVFVKGKQLELTKKEFDLLSFLIKNKGRLLSRKLLLQAIWNSDFKGNARIVDVHISRLREKIEQNPKRPEYIKTIKGQGYKFKDL